MIRSKNYHEYTDYDLEPGGLRKLDYLIDQIQNSYKVSPHLIRILDVGCGNGNIALPLAYLGYEVVGLDSFPEAIEQLGSKNQFSNLSVISCSFEEYNPEDRFDVIIMSEFLEHTKEPKAILDKAKRLLKENGLLLLTVPNGFSLEETIRRISGSTASLRVLKKKIKIKIKDQVIQSSAESPHLQFWTLFGIKTLIHSAGFNIQEVKPSAFLFKEAYYILGRFFIKRGSPLFHWFDRLDSGLAKFTPLILASGWIIVTGKEK